MDVIISLLQQMSVYLVGTYLFSKTPLLRSLFAVNMRRVPSGRHFGVSGKRFGHHRYPDGFQRVAGCLESSGRLSPTVSSRCAATMPPPAACPLVRRPVPPAAG